MLSLKYGIKKSWVYYNISYSYYMIKNYKLSKVYIKKFINERPKHFRGYMHLAKIFIKEKNYEKAICQLSSSIVLSPDNAVLYKLRAKAYNGIGNYKNEQRDKNKLYAILNTKK